MLNEKINPLIVLIVCVFFIVSVGKAVENFRMTEKDYLRIEDERFSFYRGSVLPRKIIPLHLVKQVTQVNDVILLKLVKGSEKEIYLDWLAEKDVDDLKKVLAQRVNFDSKRTIT